MLTETRARVWLNVAGMLLSAAGVSSCNSDTVGPEPSTTPSGVILAFDRRDSVVLIEAKSGTVTPFGTGGEPIAWANAALGKDGRLVSGTNYQAPDQVRTLEIPTASVRFVYLLSPGALVGSTKISPDGGSLAISGLGLVVPNRFELATIDLGTLELTLRWSATAQDGFLDLASIAWLPDQSGILALAVQPQGVRVARLTFATGALDYLTDRIGQAIDPSFDLSPDGQVIAYSRVDGRTRFITFDGSAAPGYPETLPGTYPAFSPDGRFIAFTKRNATVPTDLEGIWIHRLSDGEEWRLLPADSPITILLDWE